MTAERFRYPIWVRGDLDGFFGLMVDNLVQVLLIIDLCKFLCGLPDELIFGRILPGVGISLLIGNVFYGVQAHWVARRHRNATCTALPYGINTPSVIAYAYFIMAPVYRQTEDPQLAWLAGLLACLVSGVIEFAGAFVAEKLRRATPRAALLGVLAAVGITFIAADFAFRIYTRPLIGLLPLAILMLAYFARFQFPFRIPGGLLAIVVGSLIAWGTSLGGVEWFGGVHMSTEAVGDALGRAADGSINFSAVHWIAPTFAGHELWTLFQQQPNLLVLFLTVSIPMGIINVLGALQNIESAEAGGDRFATGPSLAVNGLGSIAAGLFGSAFPTTIYIGHPGWKALGARASYSIVNGVFFTVIFLFGLGPLLRALIPIEAGAAIVVYIGIIITAQAFQATAKSHAPAVAVALFPALAAIVVVTLGLYFDHPAVAVPLAQLVHEPGPTTEYLAGMLTLTGANSGWIVVTLILSAVGAALIDHKYKAATVWMGVATVLTLVGAIHAYRLEVQRRPGEFRNVVREYFIWQSAEYVHLHASPMGEDDGVAPAESASAQAVATTVAVTRPEMADAWRTTDVIAYRGYPIVVGYGLATVVFGLAGWWPRRRGRGEPGASQPEADPGAGSSETGADPQHEGPAARLDYDGT